jgi:hypothetical protein
LAELAAVVLLRALSPRARAHAPTEFVDVLNFNKHRSIFVLFDKNF